MNYIGIPGIKESYRAEFVPVITPEKIIQVVCDHFGLNADHLKSSCRDKELVHARHVIFYFLRKHTSISLKNAGRIFNRDHTTVLHGLDKLSDIMDTEPAVKAEVEMLGSMIKGDC